MKLFSLLLHILLTSFTVIGQTLTSNQVQVLLEESKELRNVDPAKALVLAKDADEAITSQEIDSLRIEGTVQLANAYYYNDFFDSTILVAEPLLKIVNISKVNLYDINSVLGLAYYRQLKFEKSISYQVIAIKIAEELNDKELLMRSHYNLSIVYDDSGISEGIIDNYQKALGYARELKDYGAISSILRAMGTFYRAHFEDEKANQYYTESLEVVEKHQPEKVVLRAFSLNSLGNNLVDLGRYPEAIARYEEAEKLSLKSSSRTTLISAYIGISNAYRLHGDSTNFRSYYTKSSFYGNKLIEAWNGDEENVLAAGVYEMMAHVNYNDQNFQQAYDFLKKAKTLQEERYNTNIEDKITELNRKFELDKKEEQIRLNELEIEGQANEKKLLAVVIGSLALLILITFISWRRKVINNKKLLSKNQEIEAKNDQVTQLEEMKSRWYVNVAHELKTPITLIQGPINKILKNDKLNPVDKQDLIIANKSTKHLNKLVMEMLDLSKVDKGHLELKKAAVDVGEIVRSTAAAFDSMAINNGIRLTIQAQATIWMDLDSSRIRKVVENLITNAFKFTQEDGKINIELMEQKDHIVLCVSDTGEGISEEDLPHIFERYFQSHSPAKSRSGGTGVGLSLSNEIVELHGGTIAVESREGEGSIFKVQLPKTLVVAEPEISDKEEDPVVIEDVEDQPPYTQVSTGVPRILLVEDNYEMRKFIQSILKERYAITLAKDGQEALQKLVGITYDLIISDIMMPRMDGKQLIEKVKSSDDTKDIPLVVLTALNDDEDKLDVLRTGVDDYLAKPFDAEELKLRISNLIANRNSRAEEAEGEFADNRIMVKIEEDIKNHIGDTQYAVSMMAENANMSVRSLHRMIKQKTGLTPLGLINELKLQHAMRLLEKGEVGTLKEVCAAIGFERTDRFSTAFKKRFGKRPSDYL